MELEKGPNEALSLRAELQAATIATSRRHGCQTGQMASFDNWEVQWAMVAGDDLTMGMHHIPGQKRGSMESRVGGATGEELKGTCDAG